MPYSNIVYIKLFIELLDKDDRFLYQLNESQQLLYVKMLMLAGKTLNKIPKKFSFIRNTINYAHDEECFNCDIKRIMNVFPKLKESEQSYYFEKFEELHNFVDKEYIKNKKDKKEKKDFPSVSQGKHHNTGLQEAPDKEEEVDKEEEYNNILSISGDGRSHVGNLEYVEDSVLSIIPDEEKEGVVDSSPPIAVAPPNDDSGDEKINRDSLREVVNHYKHVKGWDSDANWNKLNFARCSKSAKKLLIYRDGNVDEVKMIIDKMCDDYKRKVLDWTLETVVVHACEYVNKPVDKNKSTKTVGKWV